ncbi:MAG TPA: XDD4 family exosortase-dependent surface protein [Vicinamibacterales bacterium]|jgi:hypothetical protein|nr:XDD4 family exosortase-dependent surface protein [Vicinamibacterales bacterium]
MRTQSFGSFAATALLGIGLMLAPTASQASSITYVGSSGSLAASVTFDDSTAGVLTVTLTNTSVADTLDAADLLTAVFFSVAGDPALTRVSAILAAGSTAEHGGTTDPGGVVGGEWAYLNGLSQYGANQGISSSGLGIFGPGDRFPGSDLTPPDSPDGAQWGLASAGDDPSTGNASIADPIIQNSVVFTLNGAITLADISNVTFQYGTGLDEPSFGGDCSPTDPACTVTQQDVVPEPASLLLLGSGLAFAARTVRRRQRK